MLHGFYWDDPKDSADKYKILPVVAQQHSCIEGAFLSVKEDIIHFLCTPQVVY